MPCGVRVFAARLFRRAAFFRMVQAAERWKGVKHGAGGVRGGRLLPSPFGAGSGLFSALAMRSAVVLHSGGLHVGETLRVRGRCVRGGGSGCRRREMCPGGAAGMQIRMPWKKEPGAGQRAACSRCLKWRSTSAVSAGERKRAQMSPRRAAPPKP